MLVQSTAEFKGKLILISSHQVQTWCLVTSKLIAIHSSDHPINSSTLIKSTVAWVALATSNGLQAVELPDFEVRYEGDPRKLSTEQLYFGKECS